MGPFSLGHIAPSARSKLAPPRKAFFAFRILLRCLSSLPWSCQRTNYMGQNRVELLTPALSERCSNQLSYCPLYETREKGKKTGSEAAASVHRTHFPFSKKGGDPAAPSGTTTLLRLHPPREASLRQRPPCGWPAGFGRAPLGWCDGRCVQDPGTYSPRHADPRLLAIPTSRSRVSDSDPDWGRFFALRSASRPRFALWRPL